MAVMKKKCKKCEEGAPAWLLTYGDMVTLVLTFFVLLFTTAEQDITQFQLVLAAFQGLGNLEGGNTLSEGKLAEMGNTVNSLPAMQAGRSLAQARRAAVTIFEPEVKSRVVKITQDERGLVISLASDAFFESGSARLRREDARETIAKLASLLTSPAMAGRFIRFEGHTDNTPVDPESDWPTNWRLGADRAINTMLYTQEFARDPALERRFQVMSYGEMRPVETNETREGRAYNRRVDIIILTQGNL